MRRNLTDVERLAILETQMLTIAERLEGMDSKLDDLGALKHKGVGAFWAASALLGTGIVGLLAAAIEWLRG